MWPTDSKNAFRLALIALLGIAATQAAREALADLKPAEAAGQALAMDIAKGNCLACHAIPGDPRAVTSANIGPPLAGIRARFPQRERLREQLHDPMRFNPDTVMPPFGKHGILTDKEIEDILDYLYTL